MNITVNFSKSNTHLVFGATDYDVQVEFDDGRDGHLETKHTILNDGIFIKDLAGHLKHYYTEYAKITNPNEDTIVTVSGSV